MFEQRLKNLQKSLAENKIDALIVSSAVNIAYLTGYSNFSKDEREAYLFITESNAILFTDGRYIEAVRDILPKGINVFLHTELYKRIKSSKLKRIGVEQNFTVAELKRFKKETGLHFVLIESFVEQMRTVKDESEIKNIRAACRLTDKTFKMIRPLIQNGVAEREIAWIIEKFIKEAGGELAFDTIVAFGANAAIPHHMSSNKKLLKSDQFVLLDFGVKVNGYCSDMTRTLLTKNASDRAKKIYETVLAAQQKAIDYLGSGSDPEAKTVAKNANDYIVAQGFEKIPHGLGHGIGIAVHERPTLSPKSKDKLVRNNVFTIEPGIYVPGFGGVRIEDDFILSDKLEQLTKSQKELIEI